MVYKVRLIHKGEIIADEMNIGIEPQMGDIIGIDEKTAFLVRHRIIGNSMKRKLVLHGRIVSIASVDKLIQLADKKMDDNGWDKAE